MINNTLRITIQNQLKSLFYLIFLFILYVSIATFFNFEIILVCFIGIGFILFLFPALVLHIEYYIRNKGEEYELVNDKIILNRKNKIYTYSNEDIKKIVVFVAPNYYFDTFYITAFENYHFAKIELSDGKFLYLTSLLAPSGIDKAFDAHLREIPYIKKKRLFCTTLC